MQGDREQRGHGPRAHRRHVAQVHRQRLAPQFARRGGAAQEMDPLGEQVGGEEQRLAPSDRQHRAVVADPLERVRGEVGEAAADGLYESEFGHRAAGCSASMRKA